MCRDKHWLVPAFSGASSAAGGKLAGRTGRQGRADNFAGGTRQDRFPSTLLLEEVVACAYVDGFRTERFIIEAVIRVGISSYDNGLRNGKAHGLFAVLTILFTMTMVMITIVIVIVVMITAVTITVTITHCSLLSRFWAGQAFLARYENCACT